MKTAIQVSFVIALLLCLSLSSFAAQAESVTLNLSSPTQVNGTTLKAGDYQLVINKNGEAVKVTFLSGKKEVLSAEGTFVAHDQFPTPVSAVVARENGTKTLQEIWVSKIKGAIVLNRTSASVASPKNSTM